MGLEGLVGSRVTTGACSIVGSRVDLTLVGSGVEVRGDCVAVVLVCVLLKIDCGVEVDPSTVVGLEYGG